MRYWGIDIGRDLYAAVARDSAGDTVSTIISQSDSEIIEQIEPADAVACEWTGGRARDLLEKLIQRGVTHLYIYKGSLRADRLHLGFDRKSDVADAATISYALWASLQPNVPFRPNALTDYAVVREVYALRGLLRVARKLTVERARWEQSQAARTSAGLDPKVYKAVAAFHREQEAMAWQRLRLECAKDESVMQVVRILSHYFPHGDRGIYELALLIAPLARFASVSALRRYCGVLPQHGESAGKVVERPAGRRGNMAARGAMGAILQSAIAIGNGARGRRGSWRDYYDRLRTRMTHGEAMIRMMHRLLGLVWRAYQHGEFADPLPIERRLTRSEIRRQQKERVLELVSKGFSDLQCARLLGIHNATISQWKRRDPNFLERYIRARIRAGGHGLTEVDHGNQRDDSGRDSPTDRGGDGVS